MRKFIYIFAATLICASCVNEYPDDLGILPIFRGYMQFTTDVSSRTHLAEEMQGKSFGVIGYKYSPTSSWEGSKSTTKPWSDFYNVKVACDANGACTYDLNDDGKTNDKQWENNLYSFFAYHPFGAAGIELSGKDVVGTPMLTYTYPWLNTTGNIDVCDTNSPIVDLMTAEAVDADGKGDGRVRLNFKHRMFAFEVLVNNYNENSDGKTDARREITNMTLTLEGLSNTSMTIPLSMMNNDENSKIKYTAGTIGTRTFKISNNTLVIPAYNETIERTFNGKTELTGKGVATSISKYGSTNGGYLVLIPQEGSDTGVKGTLDWVERKYVEIESNDEHYNQFTSTITFQPGVLYQIYINFVGSGITISLIEAGNWDTGTDVEHRFE